MKRVHKTWHGRKYFKGFDNFKMRVRRWRMPFFMTGVFRLRALFVIALVAVPAASQVLHADAAGDLASFSVFGKVDPAQGLKQPVAARGPKLSNDRDLSVQAWCVVNAPLQQAVATFQRWDAQPHADLGNYASGVVSASPSAADFSALASAPGNSFVRAFDAATNKLPGGDGALQFASGDPAKFSGASGSKGGAISAKAVAFWSQILAERAKAFAGGGLSAIPAYQTAAGAVKPSAEAARMLDEQPALRKQFGPLIDGARSAQVTWNLFKTERLAAVALAAAWSKTDGSGWRHVSLNFYASGGFYTLIEFTQFWPVTVNGKAMTLVWRGEAISSGEIEALHGVERMGASATTMKEVRRSLASFMQAAGK